MQPHRNILLLAAGAVILSGVFVMTVLGQYSRDGRPYRLAYIEHGSDGEATLKEVDGSGKQTSLFTYRHAPGFNGNSELSPDGNALAYTLTVSTPNGPARELRIYRINEHSDQMVDGTVDDLPALAWDANSDSLAYTRHAGDGFNELVVFRPKERQYKDVLRSPSSIGWPFGWTKTGDEILYFETREGTQQLRAISAEGRDRLIASLGSIGEVLSVNYFSLSSDGTHILCQETLRDGVAAAIVDVNTGEIRIAFRADHELFGLRWRGDNHIVYAVSDVAELLDGLPLEQLSQRRLHNKPLTDNSASLQVPISKAPGNGVQVVRTIGHSAGVLHDDYNLVSTQGFTLRLGTLNSIDIVGWLPAEK